MKRLYAAAGPKHVSRSAWNNWRNNLGDTSAKANARSLGLKPPLPIHETRIAFFRETIEMVRHLRRPGVQFDLFQ